MSTVTLAEAQANLAELVDRLGPEDELIIIRDDKPVAKLVPTSRETPRPVYGRGKGKLVIISDDDEHLKDFDEYM